MERAILKKVRGRPRITFSDVLCTCIALFLGNTTTILSPFSIFIFVSYSYLRNHREAYIGTFVILLSLLYRNVTITYFYALGFTLIYVLIYMLKFMNQSIHKWIPYIIGIVLLPYGYRTFGFHPFMIMESMVAIILLKEAVADVSCEKHCYQFTESILGAMMVAVGLYASSVFPLYQTSILFFTYISIACICSNKTTIALLSFVILYSSLPMEQLYMILLCMIFQKEKFFLAILLTMIMIAKPLTLEQCILYVAIIIFVVCIHKEYLPFLHHESIKKTNSFLEHNNILRRQIHNYAGIFQLLAEYYEQIHDTGAEVLQNMATALQYNAEQIQKVHVDGNYEKQIRTALEGYLYEVLKLQIDEERDGCITFELEIANMRRGEIRTTIQPLLEHLLHRKLEVISVQKKHWIQGFTMMMCDALTFDMEAYGDSIKNAYTENGDTFSIFHFRQSMICMISDGMGNGKKAAESSKLITSIFQRMITSGMSQDSAIRCINKLIQSDMYATLDVLCINRLNGKALISKSAACPTYLIRDKEIFEINGNALPVGIISTIEPDCFEVQLQKHDEFIMVSDGISKQEIYSWINTRNGKNNKENLACLYSQLTRKRRKDDSTMIDIVIKESSEKRG